MQTISNVKKDSKYFENYLYYLMNVEHEGMESVKIFMQ